MAKKITNVLLTMVTLTAAVLLTGCEDLDLNPIKMTETKSYEISGSQCTTGKQEYKTDGELCVILLNNERNNNCAFQERVQMYAEKCGPIEGVDLPGSKLSIASLSGVLSMSYNNQNSLYGITLHTLSGEIQLQQLPTDDIASLDFSYADVEVASAAGFDCKLYESKFTKMGPQGRMSYSLTFINNNYMTNSCERFAEYAQSNSLSLQFKNVKERHHSDSHVYKRDFDLYLRKY